MGTQLLHFLGYILHLLILTLGAITLCGLTVELCSRAFIRLTGGGSDTVFDVTAVIGTPVHELGHAAMCLLFGHRINRIKLWSPRAKNGVYGYVEHSYNRKNPWARLGNLFIGVGPIFSGLGVIALILFLCFPTQWNGYLAVSRGVLASTGSAREILDGILSLLFSLPSAVAAHPIRSLLGLLVIMAISLHVSLSWQDIRSAAGALPLFALMLLVFGGVTWLAHVNAGVLWGLRLLNLRLLSLFGVVIAFAALWVVLALLLRAIRVVIKWF